MNKIIHGHYTDVYFYVAMPDTNMVLVEGDSATGKTFFYKACTEVFYNRYPFYAMTYPPVIEDLKAHIKSETPTMFILDRTDLWLKDEVRDLIIANSQHFYIVIGRYIDLTWSEKEIIQLTHEGCLIHSSNVTLEEVIRQEKEDRQNHI